MISICYCHQPNRDSKNWKKGTWNLGVFFLQFSVNVSLFQSKNVLMNTMKLTAVYYFFLNLLELRHHIRGETVHRVDIKDKSYTVNPVFQ